VTAERYAANVDWFMERAAGRPVLWFNVHLPSYATKVATFNDILDAAAVKWPNMRVLDWHGYVAAHPEVLHGDKIHLASHEACRQGRFALIQADVPPVTGVATPDPSWLDPGPSPSPAPNPVSVEYQRTGGPGGPLGSARGPVTCGHKGDGCVQFFTKGAIAWSPGTGTHVMTAAAATAWRTSFDTTGRVGYPTAVATCGLLNGGCRQSFERGWIYWSPATLARDVMTGPILTRYLALGAERSSLGYPSGPFTCGLSGTGCVQDFQNGSLYWSPTTGTRVVGLSIGQRYAAPGTRFTLGYPTMDTTCVFRGGGCGQHFEGGSLFAASRTAPAYIVSGAIRSTWLALGGPSSSLGYPTMDTRCGLQRGGCGQHFQGGTLYWSPTTGAQVVGVSIRTRYLASGAQASGLGYPTTGTTCAYRGGGCGQHFEGGSLFATSRTAHAYVVAGPIRTRWLSLGGPSSRYGYPVADPQPIAGGSVQRFQHGTITYRNGTVN
jgi:uncharacterized protein with LGFP repeats